MIMVDKAEDCRGPACGECNACKDYESLESDAAQIIRAHIAGDKFALDEAIEAMKSNGRDGWWNR